MPDWSYQTIFKPALFRLPPETARDATLGAMGALSRLPGGSLVIRTLGHMESHPILKTELCGVPLRYPVGLSGSLDPHGAAHDALAQFGFGYIEIGPVTVRPVKSGRPLERDKAGEAIVYPEPAANDGMDAWIGRLKRKRKHKLPYMFRVRPMPGSGETEALAELGRLVKGLSPYGSAFFIDALHALEGADDGGEAMKRLTGALRPYAADKPLLLYVPLETDRAKLRAVLQHLDASVWKGLVLGEALQTPHGSAVGTPCLAPGASLTRFVREIIGPSLPVVAGAGVHQPSDALLLQDAGANLVQLHSGLVYAGPGLPKRVNEAILYRKTQGTKTLPEPFWKHWGWMCLLGLGMIFGGVLAWLIAATVVVLPYDVAFLGMTSQLLSAANARMLPFMSHDRITLAGTMISIGVVYFMLARFGLKYGQHWSQTALMTSGLFGFGSFFLYLGYGYFDPLHAAVAAILLPMFLLSMRGRADEPPRRPPNLRNDRTWRLAQWGQLMMVALGFGLALGGAVISYIGVTDVFVATDLAYLCATPDMLQALNDRIIPLVAHDRAGFGGALLSDALAISAAALWGIRQGERWLWWMFALGGFPGFLAGFSVHAAIGYTDFIHLLPAYFAVLLYAGGLVLLFPYMVRRQSV